MNKLFSVIRPRDMKRALLAGLLALGLGVAATASQAIAISFAPSAQTRLLGQTASVDIVVRDLAADQQVVSGYDLDVLYDASILNLLSVTFGSGLGAGTLDSIFGYVPGTGRIDLFETSFLTDSMLAALQGGNPLVLATLNFTGIGVGISPLIFDAQTAPGILLTGRLDPNSDPSFPAPTVLTVTAEDGSITIINDGGSVPEPGTLAMLLLGLAGIAGLRRKMN
jgi:hypothetical protein